MKRLIALALFLSAYACIPSIPARQTLPPIDPDLVIFMSRGACFGACPVYQLTIHGDGKVTYKGEAYVATLGSQSTEISPDQIQALVSAFDKADFFSLKDQYIIGVRDLASVTISITLDGRSKRIWHYGTLRCDGDLDNAPPELCELEKKIDEIANASQWTDSK